MRGEYTVRRGTLMEERHIREQYKSANGFLMWFSGNQCCYQDDKIREFINHDTYFIQLFSVLLDKIE